MMSPRSKGLFHCAIAQSGIGGFGPFRRLAAKQDERESQATLGERFAAKMGVGKSADVATALRALPWKKVADLGDGESGVEPVVDGDTIPDDPQRVFATGRQHRVPFIAGANSFEGNLSLLFPWGDQPPKPTIMANIARLAPLYGKAADDKSLMLDLYGDVFFRVSARSLVGQMQRVETPAWFYHFDYVRKSARKHSPGAGHGAEVPYVFNDVPFFPAAEDKAVARTMQGHWIQFAKTGNPNGPGLPDWPAFTPAAPATMVYAAGGVRAVPDLDKTKFSLLTELLTQVWPISGAANPPARPDELP
jgi:para-nitrobenzyl esterase